MARGVQVVHLPYQDAVMTELPFVYFPHDLQHHHLPHFFTDAQIRHRETRWRKRAVAATCVVAAGQHVKRDLESLWGIERDKIVVYPFPSPPRLNPSQTSPYAFSEPYVMYPSVFWPHKNHERLVEAFAILRSRGMNFRLALTGARGSSFTATMRKIERLGVADTVHYYGHVSEAELSRLIQDSAGVVIPSLFEAVSLTAFDAMRFNRPIVCSDREFFREQCGESAEYFDPLDTSSIASAIELALSKSQQKPSPMLCAGDQSALSLEAFANNLLNSYEFCRQRSSNRSRNQ
jgi:glycosyltransferase involved in cell wall biosynthesis